MKVVIVGGGIAGLSLAYYLSKHKEYKIELYERHEQLGGYARTVDEHEHSPRVILPGYKHFKEICFSIPAVGTSMKIASSKDMGFTIDPIAAIKVVYSLMANISIPFDNDKIALKDVLPDDIDDDTYRYIVAICAKIGEHPDVMPVSKLTHLAYTLISPFDDYYTFKKSTGEALFKPWGKYLLMNGVHIYMGQTVDSITYDKNRVKHITINNKNIYGDIFVLALDVTGLSKIYKSPSIENLKSKTKDLQLGLQIVFNRLIKWKDNTSADYLTLNTDWYIILQRREISWDLPYSSWSICLPYIDRCRSTRTNKLAKNCDVKDMCDEIIWQVSKYCDIYPNDVKEFKVWESWFWDGLEWTTYEPYFSQKAGSYRYRPENTTPYTNLFLAGAITRTNYHQWYMEGASESAKTVYNLIHNKSKKKDHVLIWILVILSIVSILLVVYSVNSRRIST